MKMCNCGICRNNTPKQVIICPDFSDELQYKVYNLLSKGFEVINDQDILQLKIKYKGEWYRFTQTLI